MSRPAIPDHLRPVRRTPDFTAATVPAGLLAAHRTTAWAELVVTSGTVVFVEEEAMRSIPVGAGERHVIVPELIHHVEPEDDAEFHVQFYAD